MNQDSSTAGRVPKIHRETTSSQSAPVWRFLLVLGVSIAVAIVDQISKHVAQTQLPSSGVQLVGALLRLDYTQNTGAAFGIFANGGITLTLVAFAVIAGIMLSYRRVAASAWIIRGALGLIAGGACGNVIDRLRLGYVIDFIHLHWWPVFNLGDSAITIGVILLVLNSVRAPRSIERQ